MASVGTGAVSSWLLALAMLLALGTAVSHAGETKLRWVPYRPSMPEATATAVRTASRQPRADVGVVHRTAAKRPTRLAQQNGGSPFSDPFGDPASPNPEQPTPNTFQPTPSEPDRPARRNQPSKPAESDPAYSPPADQNDLDAGLDRDFPSFNDDFDEQRQDLDYECPSIKELKPIGEITCDIRPDAGELPKECPIERETYQPRDFAMTTFTWKASSLCHKPLYFEDVQLERYGHSWGPYLQPFVSGAHFFATVPILPYKMGMYPPQECMYTLGYYRPGSCAPYMLDPIPLSVRGGLAQAGAVLGGVYLIP